MARLTTQQRKNLPDSAFAGPGRTYPVQDKSHARFAEEMAGRAVKAGRMSSAERDRIDAHARRVLHEPHRGNC